MRIALLLHSPFTSLAQMVESNATLYLGEEMLVLHQESLESFFGNPKDDDGARRPSEAGGGGNSSRADEIGSRTVSDSGTAGAEGRTRATSSQVRNFPQSVVYFTLREDTCKREPQETFALSCRPPHIYDEYFSP